MLFGFTQLFRLLPASRAGRPPWRGFRVWLWPVVVALNCGALACGQDPPVNPAASQPPEWANRGHWTLGAQLAMAIENPVPHDLSHVYLLVAQPQLGYIVHDFVASRSPVRRFEILGEGTFGNAVHPGGRVTGGTLVFRFDGKNHGRLIPFLDLASGAQHTTLYTRAREINGPTQFSPQGGPGIQYFFNPQRAFVVEYRFYHMSNGGLQGPNMGLNASMITMGFRWLRRRDPSPERSDSPHSHNPFHYLFGAD